MFHPLRLEGEPEYSTKVFKYGLPPSSFVIDGEHQDYVAESLSRMFDAYEPKGTDELFLIERILYSNILVQRAFSDLQSYYFVVKRGEGDFNNPDKPNHLHLVSTITRYLVQHERSAERANEMFYRNRAARRKEKEAEPATKPPATPTKQSSTGFVSKNAKPPAPEPRHAAEPTPKIPPIA
jgi:hypothetical protein